MSSNRMGSYKFSKFRHYLASKDKNKIIAALIVFKYYIVVVPLQWEGMTSYWIT